MDISEIKPDDFVSSVVSDSSQPGETVLLSGFVRHLPEENSVRVYSDLSLNTYLDIKVSDVIHSQPIPHSPLGGSYIWIRKDAETHLASELAERSKARFLEGPITARFGRLRGYGAHPHQLAYAMEGDPDPEAPPSYNGQHCTILYSRQSTGCIPVWFFQRVGNIPLVHGAYGSPFGYH